MLVLRRRLVGLLGGEIEAHERMSLQLWARTGGSYCGLVL